MEDLYDRVTIITGAAGGIGSATATALAAAGARLVLVDQNDDALKELVSRLDADVLPLCLDVSSEQDMNAMAEQTLANFGQIDALVTSAAILRGPGGMQTVADTSFDDWTRIMRINLTGTFLANRAVLPAMLAAKSGDIINLSSTSGKQGRAFDGAYSASKAGIVGLSEALAEEVMRQGIRVQTVLPDAVDTGLWAQSGSTALKPQSMLPADRIGALIVYLLSLPRDTYLLNTVVSPITQRRGRPKKAT